MNERDEELSPVEKFCEVLVLSLFLLFMLPRMSIMFLPPLGTVIIIDSSEQSKDKYPSRCLELCHTLQLNVNNLEEAFKGYSDLYETTAALSLGEISVYSSPLSAPFSSSKASIQSSMQYQYLLVDFHAFVVFSTSDGTWWALDKTAEGIFVSWGKNQNSVLKCFDGHLRPNPRSRWKKFLPLASDVSDRTVDVLVRRLTKILKSNKYDLIERNCQHFAKEIFDKLAIDNTWELSTVSDLTSPLTLLSRLLRNLNGGYLNPLAKYLYIVFLFYELYLLFGESSSEIESHHYLFVVYTVIYVTGIEIWICYVCTITICYMLNYPAETMLSVIYIGLPCILILEAKYYSFLGIIRKRAIQYRKMCQSATWFGKYISLPLGYTMVYVGPLCLVIESVIISLFECVGIIIYSIHFVTSHQLLDIDEFVTNLINDVVLVGPGCLIIALVLISLFACVAIILHWIHLFIWHQPLEIDEFVTNLTVSDGLFIESVLILLFECVAFILYSIHLLTPHRPLENDEKGPEINVFIPITLLYISTVRLLNLTARYTVTRIND